MISVIITTSPIPSHPSTSMIDAVIKSIGILPEYELFIVCDGIKISNKNEWKSGKVIDEKSYIEYMDRLSERYPTYNIIKRDSRCGFAKNVHDAMLLSRFDYVLICQHDFMFAHYIDFNDLVHRYFIQSDVNYIGFHNIDAYLNKNAIQKPKNMPELYPLNFWYDKNHLARKSFYLESVFENPSVRVKNFIEDSFGQYQKNDLKINPNRHHEFYRSYLLNANSLLNLNGRKTK